MSRTSSTFGKPAGIRSSIKNFGEPNSKMSTSKVTEPLRSQSPCVVEWSKSLRSRSTSPSRMSTSTLNHGQSPSRAQVSTTKLKARSPSPSRLAFSTSKLKDLMPKKSRTDSSSHLRKSTSSWSSGINLAGTASKNSNELANIEGEYIKNLQQQIYFLELESNYLREQAKKATDMHPKMTVEAERMLVKLRQMQNEMDELNLEIRRKETSLNATLMERERTEDLLREKEESGHRQKLVMTDEIITMKKKTDRMELEAARKDNQLLEAKTEVDKSSTALRNAELKLTSLKNQLDQRTEQYQMTQIALEEKRSVLISTEVQLREVEDRYYNNNIEVQDKVTQELRDEIRFLRQKVKETEIQAEKDRFLREKMVDENALLNRENASYNHKISDFHKHMDRERSLRETTDLRQRDNIAELVNLREREKQLQMQLDQSEIHLQRDQEKCQHYLEQLTKQESLASTAELQLNSTKMNLSETDSLHKSAEMENSQLRKDKMLLVDHVAELQRKMEIKDHQLISLQSEVSSLEARLQDLDYQKTLESTVHSQKWEEFGRLAESMRTLSSTMARSTSPTHSQSQILQY